MMTPHESEVTKAIFMRPHYRVFEIAEENDAYSGDLIVKMSQELYNRYLRAECEWRKVQDELDVLFHNSCDNSLTTA
jgi:hypothetical protein